MAQLLAYDRPNQQPTLLDTINVATATLGGTVAAAETTNAFPNRTKNIVSTYLGDAYLLYLQAGGDVELAGYNGATWPDVAGFFTVSPTTGGVVPGALHVHEDRLFAFVLDDGAANERIFAVRSDPNDGTTWAFASTFVFGVAVTAPLGHSIRWRNAIWFATSNGLVYYIPSTNTWGTIDTGDDTLLTGDKVCQGMFASEGGNLYFIMPNDTLVTTPQLYQLDPAWDLTAPPASPAWSNAGVLFPTAGAITPGPDNGTYALFRNKVGVLTAWYSGNVATKVVQIQDLGSGLQATDVSTTVLPSGFSSQLDTGWSVFVDDRRRTNEQFTILGRDVTAIPNSIVVFSWDGSSQATLLGRLDAGGGGLDLLLPDEERGDFRLWTDVQPTCHIRSTAPEFPGRTRINYTIRDQLSRPIDISGEYSVDSQTWFPMSQGDGDDGSSQLASTSGGNDYFFFWDSYNDLAGDLDRVDIRMIARLAGV